eukprot:5045957-Pleurochrysis_carterae.AAC.1
MWRKGPTQVRTRTPKIETEMRPAIIERRKERRQQHRQGARSQLVSCASQTEHGARSWPGQLKGHAVKTARQRHRSLLENDERNDRRRNVLCAFAFANAAAFLIGHVKRFAERRCCSRWRATKKARDGRGREGSKAMCARGRRGANGRRRWSEG